MAELAIAAATGLGASAGTAATVGTIASVGLTAASALGQISAGNQQAASLKLQSRQDILNANLERLEGRRQAVEIKKQLENDLASQNAIFGARGILAGEGSALAAENISRKNASDAIDRARFNSNIAATNSEQRAANARADASSARKEGLFGAASTVGSFKTPQSFKGFGGSKVPIPKRKPTLLSGI